MVEDLEALKELNDELEENHVETEKQLQEEIDQKNAIIREHMKRAEAFEETIADYEHTIQQFRELVFNLQDDIDQLKQNEVGQSNSEVNDHLMSQSQAMISLNMQLQSTVMKAQAKQIDLELRKLEAAQAAKHLTYIEPFLPESFFRRESNSIRCVLLLERLVFKAELVVRYIEQTHSVETALKEEVTGNLKSVCEMRQKLIWLADVARMFGTFMSSCSVMYS
ncbi:dynein associated protein-domain-containing protein [Syncephalis plumigaleata]|nr:dynein associated protein-domain-containing protein [Syncephalis plumigaleata]